VIRRRDQGRPSGTVAAFLNLVRESDPAEATNFPLPTGKG